MIGGGVMIRHDIRSDDGRSDELDRLYWQCRRGMLELDELFLRFLETSYQSLAVSDKSLFTALLKESDPELYQWLLTGEPRPAHYEDLITKIKESQ
jgi:antitoxin CptB